MRFMDIQRTEIEQRLGDVAIRGLHVRGMLIGGESFTGAGTLPGY